MPCDYRALCIELFGTDDESTLRDIARARSNNVGRKKKFCAADVAAMSELRAQGVTVGDIAKRYKTSRQVVSKYLNAKPEHSYTMRMTYMFDKRPCTDIDVNFLDRKISIKNYTDDLLHRAFGVITTPTWDDFEDFLQYRCFAKTRGDAEDLLNVLGISSYDPLQIVEATRGKTADDNMWVKVRYYER